jgi:tripartite-type tricarboxylate transporter receptor subunit TctC
MDRRQLLVGSATLAATLAFAARRAPAQAYPNQLVKFAVPFSGGSMTDILARAIGAKLAAKWGQTVIVENRPGIAGTLSVAKGPADGHTLMLTSNGHTVIKAVNENVSFDPVQDFAGVTKVASMPSILIVPANSPAKTLQELITLAKSAPGGINYGSAGLGSSTGIAAELFRQIIGANMTRVPFRGLPESNLSVLRGDTAFGFTFFNVGGDLIQANQLRALAVTGDTRLPQLPDVPTFKEAGLPQFEYDAWFGVMVPATTPRHIVTKVSRDIAEALLAPDMQKTFDAQAVMLVSSTPEAFDAQIRSDSERYGKLVGRL